MERLFPRHLIPQHYPHRRDGPFGLRRKLSLDKHLADYLPELEGEIANADRITLRMLVQHRSGIPNFTDSYNYWAQPKETDEENLALIYNLPANFEPGEDYEYSNTNYLLLGRIMDKVLGYDHFQFIKNEILRPLKLNNTFLFPVPS